MSNVQQYLLTVNADREKALSIAQDTARGMITRCSAQPKLIFPGLELKQLTLIEAVQSLGEYINDDDATIRARVIDYLSQVIGQLNPAFLSRQQVQVLCQFFCDRIEDGGAVGGLRKLQALGKFNKDMVAMTFRA